MLDLEAQARGLDGLLQQAATRVLLSGSYVLGETVERFESAMSDYLGGVHAIGVSSGTDALLACLMTLDLEPDDEVITSPFSFVATAGCIARQRARPIFVDIDPDTFNLDASSVASRITPRTRAVIPVHLYGRCLGMDFVRVIRDCQRRGLLVIEDAAQAIGAVYCDGQPAGTVGDLGCFSFYPTKNLGAAGDAGLIVTRSEVLASAIRAVRVHGASSEPYVHQSLGGNFRIDALQAAILSVKLTALDGWTRRRRVLADRYRTLLSDCGLVSAGKIAVPLEEKRPSQAGYAHVYHQFVVRAERRDELRLALHSRGIASAVYYPVPLHLQPAFAYLGHREGDFPLAERASREVLALPIFPELSEAQQDRIVAAIEEFFG